MAIPMFDVFVRFSSDILSINAFLAAHRFLK